MSSRKMILIFALPLLAACADRDLVAPGEEGAVIQAAKGGNKGKPGGGSDDGGGTWDGKQDIVYVESSSKRKGEDRLVVVNSDGSNRAIAYSLSGGNFFLSRPSLLAVSNAIVFGDDDGVQIIRLLDTTTGSISTPELLVPGGLQQAVSPDDSKIAYVRHEGSCEGEGTFDLYVYDRNEGTSTRITSNNQPAGCVTADSITTLTPAWASDTEIAVIQYSLKTRNSHVAVFDVGTIVDANEDGVIDNVDTTSTANGGGPVGFMLDPEWAPDADRAVVTVWGATVDLWIIDFSGASIEFCNITSAIDGSVDQASLGPQNKIAFRRGRGSSIVTGTVGSTCPATVSLDSVPLATSGKNTAVARPNWR